MSYTKITLEHPTRGTLSTPVALHMPELAQSMARINPERATEACQAAFHLATFGTVEVEASVTTLALMTVVRLSELVPRSRFFVRVDSAAGERRTYDIAKGGMVAHASRAMA